MSNNVRQSGKRGPARPHDARERILAAAYELFSRQGIRAVGIDAVIQRSGVARMTLYRHFASKDQLVLAFLERREQLWTKEWFQSEVERRASNPRDRLLVIFDVFHEWFNRDNFEGCTFVNTLLESTESSEALGRASVQCLARVRAFIERVAADAQIPDAEGFARQWHILMNGAIVAAEEGDRAAAQRAREVAQLLLERRVHG